MKNEKPLVICLTPVKNEEWILEKFLSAASIWADIIIIADQMSDDGSKEIAKKFNKVRLINNDSLVFNEPERQRLLISEARKIPGKKLLVALDADEFISANAFNSCAWEKMLSAENGTIVKIKLPCITPDFKRFWYGGTAEEYFYIGYMDDGKEHTGFEIHSKRIPTPNNAPILEIDEFVVMHYQFVDWERMRRKHQWYQCYERMTFPEKSVIDIFRRYTHMYRIKASDYNDVPDFWYRNYLDNSVDINSFNISTSYRWDEDIDAMCKEDPMKFKNIDLPCNDNFLLSYLRYTVSSRSLLVKFFDKILKKIGF